MTKYRIDDMCVCCGEPVPEGWMVCPACERGSRVKKKKNVEHENEKMKTKKRDQERKRKRTYD